MTYPPFPRSRENALHWAPGAIAAAGLLLSASVRAAAPDSGAPLGDIVVTATRVPERSFDLPVSIDRVEGAALREAKLGVNLSETLAGVPGLSAQNRGNYAQDLQLSVRGFGARSTFGVRGVRLYADGIPGTMPDGQGQFSHFDLTGADRIEVLRGPFSALYGNSSGGVISIFTRDGSPGFATDATVAAGSFGTRRYAARGSGESGIVNFTVDGAHFQTDGYRDHSRAERNSGNAKVRLAIAADTTLTLVANALETPAVDDPLGLTAAQLAANPAQAGTGALDFNTRKSLSQEQAGAILAGVLSPADDYRVTVYDGVRRTVQFQAIQASVEARLTHPGGVVDLGRHFRGADAQISDHRTLAGGPLRITAGTSYEELDETRRGYLNFVGATTGVQGPIRRNDANRVSAFDQYAEAEWDPSTRWRANLGVRHNDVRVRSRDELTPGSPASAVTYSATNPVAGITYRAGPMVNYYASFGRGFETPTLNDIAYRSTDGSLPGLNLGLRPARSSNYEVGMKAGDERLRLNLAGFYVKTRDELAIRTSSGGRSVFGNIGQTERRGIELGLEAHWDAHLSTRVAYTYLKATTDTDYQTCVGLPCASVVVPAGRRLAAVPSNTLYAAATWRSAPTGWFVTAETLGRGRIYADDLNAASAAGYWSTNFATGISHSFAGLLLTETLRVDNLTDRRYVGSVIVNDSNKRYFEPAAGRSTLLTVTASFR